MTGVDVGVAATTDVPVGVTDVASVDPGVAAVTGVDVEVAATTDVAAGVTDMAGVDVGVAAMTGVDVGVAEMTGMDVGVAATKGVAVGEAAMPGVAVGVAEMTGEDVGALAGDEQARDAPTSASSMAVAYLMVSAPRFSDYTVLKQCHRSERASSRDHLNPRIHPTGVGCPRPPCTVSRTRPYRARSRVRLSDPPASSTSSHDHAFTGCPGLEQFGISPPVTPPQSPVDNGLHAHVGQRQYDKRRQSQPAPEIHLTDTGDSRRVERHNCPVSNNNAVRVSC